MLLDSDDHDVQINGNLYNLVAVCILKLVDEVFPQTVCQT